MEDNHQLINTRLNISRSNCIMEKDGSINRNFSNANDFCPVNFSSLLTNYAINSLLVVTIFTSIIGNIMVWIAIYSDRRLRKLGNLFLASLALADLIVGAFVMTLELANNLMGYWMFGQRFCDIWIAFDVMCCTASILHLCAISLDRFIHIKDPLRYTQWMSKKVAILSIAALWLLSALISFLPVGLGWHKPSSTIEKDKLNREKGHFECALDLTPSYAVISSSISFYLPCIIMVALYTRLYIYAQKHVKNIRAMMKPLYSDNVNEKQNSCEHNSHHQNHHIMDHKAAITLGVIMGVFLVCWVPFFCINIIAGFCKTCIPTAVFKSLTWLGWFNSSLNPIIYSIFNSEFREAFRRILIGASRKNCCQIFSKRKASYRPSFAKNNNTNLAVKVVQCKPQMVKSSCKYSSIVINGDEKSLNKGYVDVVPIKNNLEIVCNSSDGKINSI